MSRDFWILASNSPRRRELLGLFQQPFEIHPADVNEDLVDAEKPADYVTRLAQIKAAKVAQTYPLATFILAADTTVADGDEILAKPCDPADAERMLLQLKNKTHQVYTAISVIIPQKNRQSTTLCLSNVPMRNYSMGELKSYVDSGDPFDKAGGYAIQNPQFHPVENFAGCFASVMGLPLCHLQRTIRALDIVTDIDIASHCQDHLGYQCPIYNAVLDGEDIG
jgi:MAF protein